MHVNHYNNFLSTFLCLALSFSLAFAAAGTPCSWTDPISGVWSTGPWDPLGCQNGVSSNITLAQTGSYEIVLNTPATIANLFVGGGAELTLRASLNLTRGVVDIVAPSNISLQSVSFGRCSTLTDASVITITGRLRSPCGAIVGPSGDMTLILIPEIDKSLSIPIGGSLQLNSVIFRATSSSPNQTGLFLLAPAATLGTSQSRIFLKDPSFSLALGAKIKSESTSWSFDSSPVASFGSISLSQSTWVLTNASSMALSFGSSLAMSNGSAFSADTSSQFVLSGGSAFNIEDSSSTLGNAIISDGSNLEVARSQVSFANTVIYGTVLVNKSVAFWFENFVLGSGSLFSAFNDSIIYVNSSASITAGSRARVSASRFKVSGAGLSLLRSSFWASSSSQTSVSNGFIFVGGCENVPWSQLDEIGADRPCSIVISENSSLSSDNGGDVAVVGRGLLAVMTNATVTISSLFGCHSEGQVVAIDAGNFFVSGSMALSPGCSIRALRSSNIVLGGSAILAGSAVTIDRSNCTPISLPSGSALMYGNGYTLITNSSQMFIGNYTFFSGRGGECTTTKNCTLSVDSYSKLISVGDFFINEEAKVIGSSFSEILIETGNLFINNRSLLLVDTQSRLIVNGAAFITSESGVAAKNSFISINGSVDCLGSNNGLFIESKSQLRIGGSITLREGSAILLSESILAASLGTITTDEFSAIFLFNNSVLAGKGNLNATVYSFNSTIGGSELTDVFIRSLNLSSSSTTVASISSSGSSLKINSTTAVIAGQLTVTIQSDSVAGLKGGESIVLISSQNMTGNFESVTFSVPAGEQQQCYSVQQNTRSLAVVFSPTQSGCNGNNAGAPSDFISSNTATIIGAAVGGGIAFIAIAFVVVALVVPSVRRRVFPFVDRKTTRNDSLDS